MPIYEYRCRDCRKRYTMLTLRVSEESVPQCDKCGSRRAERLLSRFAMPKSDAKRQERLADPSAMAGIDESDPKSVARWMRKMGKEMGDEMGGEDFDAMVDEIEGGDTDDDTEASSGDSDA